MADLKISQLNSLAGSSLADNDVLAVVDTSASETKKITAKETVQYGYGLIPASTLDGDVIEPGTTSARGTVQLTDSTSSTSTTTAATPNAVKGAYDLANAALPKTGGTMTGQILGDNSTSASTPGYAFDGDPNTGLYTTGADELALTTGGSARLTIDSTGTVVIPGNFTVQGTTTTIDTTTLVVEDKNIEMGAVATPTDVTADGGGITLKGTTDKTINWVDATDAWTSSERFSVPTGTAAAPTLTFTGDPNTGIYSPGADQVAISTNGTGRLFVNSSGNIGVGTSSPGRLLSVQGIVAAYNSLGTDDSHLLFVNNGSLSSIQSTFGSTGSFTPLAFFTSNTERLRITSDGKVGLGTSSVSSKIHIQDAHTLVADSQIALIENTTTGEPASLAFLAKADSGSGGNKGAIYFDAGAGGGTADNKLQFTAQHQDTIAPAMTLDGLGRLGVGTTSPAAKLHVEGDSFFTDWIYAGNSKGISSDSASRPLLFALNGSEKARLDTSGRLLVGTSTAPTVGASANARAVIQGNSADSASSFVLSLQRGEAPTGITSGEYLGQIMFAASDGSPFAEIAAVADANAGTNDYPGRLVFSTTADGASSPTERMRIASNGVVTIQNGAVAVIGTLTDAATITPDFAANANFTVTLGGNRTIANPTNLTAGQSGSIFLVQDATGSRTLSWGSYWDFAGGTAPTLSTAANAVDRVDYIVRSSTSIHTVFTANYS